MEHNEPARSIALSRAGAGLTQKQVADFLNKSQTTIAAWETGRAQPDAKTIISLSRLFGVSIDYLLGESEYRTHDSKNVITAMFGPRSDELSAEHKETLSKFVSLPVTLYNSILKLDIAALPGAFSCITAVISAVNELVNLFGLYKSSYSISCKIDELNRHLDLASDNVKNVIFGSSDEIKPFIDELSAYLDAMKKHPSGEFSSEALQKIDQVSGALATFALELQVLLDKCEGAPKE